MNVHRLWVAIVGLWMIVTITTVWSKHAVTRHVQTVVQSAPITTSVIDDRERTLPTRNEDWAEPRVDLNGNEIDAAVGDYRVDGRGEMYERHAPDTALLHLGAPRM